MNGFSLYLGVAAVLMVAVYAIAPHVKGFKSWALCLMALMWPLTLLVAVTVAVMVAHDFETRGAR